MWIICLSILIFGQSIADDACYAPPSTYGPPCISSVGLIGVCCSYVEYSVNVIGSVNVFCQGLGTGPFLVGVNCTFGWYDLGIVNSGPARLGWSSSAGTPAIKCYGSPTGSSLTWKW
eukprot:390948_1